jgi:hypothetical protein
MSHLDVNLRVYDGESIPVSAVYQTDVHGDRLRVVIGEESACGRDRAAAGGGPRR